MLELLEEEDDGKCTKKCLCFEPHKDEDGYVGWETVYNGKPSYGGVEINNEPAELPDYSETDSDVINNSVRYSLERSHDGETVYKRGRFITVHEDELPFGLLGYTDTNSEIHLTTRNDFDIPKEEVMVHECLHCSEPDRSELEIRYLTEAEFKPLDAASARFSIYQKPIYTD